jgi:LPXTG-motif cell wall-anchored protein
MTMLAKTGSGPFSLILAAIGVGLTAGGWMLRKVGLR